MNGKASTEVMDLLHGLMADSMTEELRRGMERAAAPPRIVDPQDETQTIPNPDYEPLSPKLLAVIRAFLKDNGIDAPAHSPKTNKLAQHLRDLNPDELGQAAHFGRA